MKGLFKIDDISSTNPVAVGDRVGMEVDNADGGTALITEIGNRRNYINRQSPRGKHQQHIVAANLDQSLLLATLREPRTSQGFIDRFLVASEMYHVPSIIVVNKTDIYGKKEHQQLDNWTSMYGAVGYSVFPLSVRNNTGIEPLMHVLKEKTTLISGHSGVGKSSLLNALLPDLNLRTQDVSGWSGKGLHTTTFAEMFELPGGGRIIDTPGIKEFGLLGLSRQELSHYFPEMRDRLGECQFNNCLHVNEPGCRIKEAVEQGDIHENRYISYVNILDSIVDKNY